MADEEVKPVTIFDFFKEQTIKDDKKLQKKYEKQLNKLKANENRNKQRG